MTGCPSFPLDSKEHAMFYLIDEAELETVFIDSSNLYSNVDFTKYAKLKKIITYGIG